MQLLTYEGKKPRVSDGAFIAPTAVLIGDVVVSKGANIWFGAVLRGDLGAIIVKEGASIQDNVVIHGIPEGQTVIGENAVIGHGVVLHNCRIDEGAIIGINAVVLDFAEIGKEAVVAAGSVVTDGIKVPGNEMVAGIPAKMKGSISDNVLSQIKRSVFIYRELCANYLKEGIGRVR